MSRILLVDDSPHAQRIGERILTEEGFEVVTVSNADTALVRIEDVDPDLVIADAVMPGRTGYDICQYLRMSPRHKHVRVILTAGVLEPIDDAHAQRVEADATIKKPFEASVLVNSVRPLLEAAVKAREARKTADAGKDAAAKSSETASAPFVAVVDEEQVRAAVTIALDGSMDSIVNEIARRVAAALRAHPPEPARTEPAAAMTGLPAVSNPPEPVFQRAEPIRRVHPLRIRTSILGLETETPEPEEPSESEPPAPGSK
jgi:DNA-binding response OmpR family regulator